MTFGRLVIVCGALCSLTAGVNPSFADSPPPRFVMPALTEFWAIVERPLLSRSRRPGEDVPPEDSAAVVEEGVPAAEMMLVGTATDQRARAVAVLRNEADGTEFRVWVGDMVSGWHVKAIRPRILVLERDGQEISVTLEDPVVPEASVQP